MVVKREKRRRLVNCSAFADSRIRKLLRQLQTHKSSWAFREPVYVKDVHDYYHVIKNPMDLQMVETKIIERRYQQLVEFIGDITKIFENCYQYSLYDPKGSPSHHDATSLESFLVPKIQLLRSSMSN
ncbi:hypothetical protein DAPPUDRAFT_65377 [Daphnia pulex]|uniref:Bromo domain-containing protein n=1 Tax=Daphnia pulex TaxID=6669 RepID=E9HRJ5_DAPPU|nr:hypothetical protein DAPPUDRAFT_65377 [Daphnia pulex]|eukprot:EFX65624.1 hypothetical protein DAPPUDRAFT_65377 [Daphnia pulex]